MFFPLPSHQFPASDALLIKIKNNPNPISSHFLSSVLPSFSDSAVSRFFIAAMRPSSRSSPTRRTDSFYRYLKPGALAQLRNSKMSARSRKPILLSHRIDSPLSSPQISAMDQVPCLQAKIYGPQCLKRKKLLATRSVFLLNLGSSTPVLESSNNDSVIALYNNDSLVAH
ncbi:uncharacterized protein [Euphorbia lathyris]|uniref:uncharacterized protein n=1 Tax=Euphorbia lathyris TaxID=212925 RepID=UPI0033144D80